MVFALLVAPPAAAFHLTAHPGFGIATSVGIALAVTWVGIGCAFFSPYPIGFWVSSFAFAIYLLAAGYRVGVDRAGRRLPRRRQPATAPGVAA